VPRLWQPLGGKRVGSSCSNGFSISEQLLLLNRVKQQYMNQKAKHPVRTTEKTLSIIEELKRQNWGTAN